MKIAKEPLIAELIETTRQNLNALTHFKEQTATALNWKANAESWSILECVEHLNRYGKFYLPEMERSMKNTTVPGEVMFSSGVLGEYFVKLIRPREQQKKMKTLKDMNPLGSELSVKTLDRCLMQQKELLRLLDEAHDTNLTKAKTAVTFTRLIRLRLGDTMRFVVYHNQRHILQAQRALASYVGVG